MKNKSSGKNKVQLLNNIIGQLTGLKQMIDDERDCFDVLIQYKAIKSALNSFGNKYLEENFLKCLSKCSDKEEKSSTCKKFFSEISRV